MTLTIEDTPIGPGHGTYVIAELSANHLHDYERALRLIDAAADANADAVKLQTYTPDTITLDSDKPPFRRDADEDHETLHDLYAEAYTPWDWQPDLKEHAEANGMACFSSPFDASAVEFLDKMDVPAYKIASFEITHLPLVRTIAQKGKPIIMSTGMATIGDIDEAIETIRDNGDPPVALLRCNSTYPARPSEMDLATIPHMIEAWDVPVGLSDHTLGHTSAIVAVTLGATLIEKHLTLDRADGGPDAAFSMEPHEFARMIEAVRTAEEAKGRIRYGPSEDEEDRLIMRQSLFAVQDIDEGEAFTEDNVRVIRPGHGLPPKFLEVVLGREARTRIEKGTPIRWSNIT